MSSPKFPKLTLSFHSELKKRISDYFAQSGKQVTGNFKLYFKAILLVVSFIGVYTHLVFFTPPILLAIAECVLLGFLTAAIGFNVMHDGAHGSFSPIKWVNNVASNAASFLGASQYMWKTKHNVIHHTYTNIHGVDDDIEARPFLRLCDEQSLARAFAAAEAPGCLVLDQDVFARMVNGGGERRFAGLGFPVILMVGHQTERVVARAMQAGVTRIVEKPLLGAVLLNAIRSALGAPMKLGRARRSG